MKKYSIRLMMPDVGRDELMAVESVLQSGQLVEGAKAHEFEQLIAKKSSATHAVLCTSATVGLELALKALELKFGDEVVLPAFTHPATVLAVLNVGLVPMIVDVDAKTFNTNVELLEKGITPKTKVLMPVSWGGYPIDMSAIMNLAKKYNLKVIEDAACALGTAYNGHATGELADMTVYSFHPRKLIALGDGGAVVTSDDNLYKKLKKLKHFGAVTVDGKASFVEVGGNYRLSNILAAMGIPQLEKLEKTILYRQELAKYYNHLFSQLPWVNLPAVGDNMKANYQSYCISFSKPGFRDFVLMQLKTIGIEVQFGTYSIDREPVCKTLNKVSDLSGSHFLGDNLLTLPLHHQLTKAEQDAVFAEIQDCYRRF